MGWLFVHALWRLAAPIPAYIMLVYVCVTCVHRYIIYRSILSQLSFISEAVFFSVSQVTLLLKLIKTVLTNRLVKQLYMILLKKTALHVEPLKHTIKESNA
jgi:hypothetical protein